MTLEFTIEYRTNWGEEVRVGGDIPELGNGVSGKAYPLHTTDGIHWRTRVDITMPLSRQVHYYYQIFSQGKAIRTEWRNLPRTLFLPGSTRRFYLLQDYWKEFPEQPIFYTSAFTHSLLARRERSVFPRGHRKGLQFKAYAPLVGNGCVLAITGNQTVLGNWNPAKALPMSDANFPEWQIELDATQILFPLEYKFILYNEKEHCVVAWEKSPNRYLSDIQLDNHETLVIGDRYVSFDLPAWKGAGVAIPVFSLRSKASCGVGDFGDLKRMIDWAAVTHQQVVQILPINDTTMTHTWADSYPYNSISIYALHPMYMDLKQLGRLKDKQTMAIFRKRQQALNALTTVDYEAVNQLKWDYFRQIFSEKGESVLISQPFCDFFLENRDWLLPYAAFSYLRELYQTPDFHKWPCYQVYDVAEIEALCRPDSPHYKQISLYFYIQFNLHLQLLAVTRHARAHGVVLKGDIPIGISRYSVEAWEEPHYFNLNGQAGAPPDDFSTNGQNWGFPTYNWDVMERDGYSWWMKRFRKMAEYFDAYRMDHILGFFRIWEIPINAVHGLLGHFVPALPLTREEIENYGFSFCEDYLHPYIHDSFLEEIFGLETDYVKLTFLERRHEPGLYRMRSEFDTQRKVQNWFSNKSDEKSLRIRDGIYALLSNVLFLPDSSDPHRYHPRIGVQRDYIYRSLEGGQQAAFNRLYDHYYYHRHNEFWCTQAMKKLPQLTQATRMLVCGEDLGMIPECVPRVMNDLHILSLEIQRMPKEPMQEFGYPDRYPYHSVCTISTHDMSTLRGWWEEDYAVTQRYYNSVLGHSGNAPVTATPELCEQVVWNHLQGSSLLCILSLQDWLSLDGALRHPRVDEERINVPANPCQYWCYRMHLTLEQLMQAEGLNEKIRKLISTSGRNLFLRNETKQL